MSIKADVTELESIRLEIRSINEKRKKLKQKEKEVTNRIADYLKAKDQPGVKHQGTAVILEEKTQHTHKNSKERDIDAMSVLEKYGIKDTQKVLGELMNARKGETIIKETLKIKKLKNVS